MRTLYLCGWIALALAAWAQNQEANSGNSGRRTLKAYHAVIPARNFNLGAAQQAAATNSGLQIFTYTIAATKDQNIYAGTMVGTSPSAKRKVTTNIPTYIIPVIVVIGATTFDPTVADTTCMVPPNDVPLTIFRNSPLFVSPAQSWVINA